MEYAICVLLLLYLIYKYDIKKKYIGKIFWYYVVLFYLIMLAGLRYRVGADTLAYMSYYSQVPDIHSLKISWNDFGRFQPLWQIYTSLLKTISDNFVLLQFSNAIIVNGIILRFIKKNSEYLFTSIFFYCTLYYLEFNFEIMRESISIAIFLLAVPYLLKSKWFKYFFLVSISFGFHASAYILFLIPLFRNLKLNKKLIIIFIFIIVYLAITKNIFYFINDLPISFVKDYIYSYNLNGINELNVKSTIGYIYTFFYYLIIPIGLILYNKIVLKNNFKFLQMILLMIIIDIIALMSDNIIGRLSNYLLIFYVVFLSEILIGIIKNHSMSYKTIKIFILLFIVFFNLYQKYDRPLGDNKNIKNYVRYYPYSSILNPTTNTLRDKAISDY